MIVAFSTSSPLASVALIREDGTVAWSGDEWAPRKASEACVRLLQSAPEHVPTGYLADLGPGSFTGVRVGVVLAKTLAFVHGVKCGGRDAFDLIDPDRPVALPSRKGEWFVRTPGHSPLRTQEEPRGMAGFGFDGGEDYPNAARFGPLLADIDWQDPFAFVPRYLLEPSISLPKKPYREAAG